MNILLWLLQVLLAFQAFAGGAYKVFEFDQIADTPAMSALPGAAWGAIGVFEVACAILLVVPAATKWKPGLTPLAAAALALESFVLAGLYGYQSLEMTATNPLPYVLFSGMIATFVAWGRYKVRPLG